MAALIAMTLLFAGCGDSDEPANDPQPSEQPSRAELTRGVKQYVNAIETCAVSNADGSYAGCLHEATLVADNPQLRDVPGDVTIRPGGEPRVSYEVVLEHEGTRFIEVHTATAIHKRCEPTGTERCDDGTW